MTPLIEYGFLGMFFAAFFAATIFPLGSEVVLVSLLLKDLSPFLLVVVATTGNVLGSLLNFCIGYWASQNALKKWFRLTDKKFDLAQQRFKKYGVFLLLFSWVPVIGDPITVVAGVLRVRLMLFLPLVLLGKLFRYTVITYSVLNVT